MRSRNYKADLEELADEYQEARDEEFNDQFKDFILPGGVNTNTEKMFYTEDDVQGFIDSFTFPDEEQWCTDEYESRRGSFEDAKYEEEKERRMGL